MFPENTIFSISTFPIHSINSSSVHKSIISTSESLIALSPSSLITTSASHSPLVIRNSNLKEGGWAKVPHSLTTLVKQRCQDEGVLASNNAQAQAKTVFAHDFVVFHQHSRISASGIEPSCEHVVSVSPAHVATPAYSGLTGARGRSKYCACRENQPQNCALAAGCFTSMRVLIWRAGAAFEASEHAAARVSQKHVSAPNHSK